MDNIPTGVEIDRLQGLGLSPSEARAYVALLQRGPAGAADIAQAAEITKSSAYTALRSLADLGLVEAGAGYGSRFRAVAPEQALPSLVDRQRESYVRELEEREALAKDLIPALAGLEDHRELAPEEVVEVIRDRRAMGERFDRIQLEAREEIATIVKAPIVTGGDPNPAQDLAMERGVRVRGLYERAVLDHPEIRPYLREWVDAGEEARIYPESLPLKFSVIDGRVSLLPLETPGDRSPFTTLLIRHEALGGALHLLYDLLWEKAEPFE